MYSKVLVVLALTSLAYGADVLLGANNTGSSFYNQHHEASPAIWKQTKELFINVSEDKVISKLNITDLRPDKDGEAQIASGGVGHTNVSILLKSPTIFRGYDFLVEVFAMESEVRYVPGEHHGNKTEVNNGSSSANPSEHSTAGTTTFMTGTPATVPSTGHPTYTTENTKPKTKEFESNTETGFTTESEIPVEVQQAPKMQPSDGLQFEMSE